MLSSLTNANGITQHISRWPRYGTAAASEVSAVFPAIRRANAPVTIALGRDNLPSGMLRRVLFLLIACLIALPSAGVVVVPQNSSWRFYKGLSEASAPDVAAWRDLDFDDAGWSSGQTAFFYENQPGSANAYSGLTTLSDMFGNYTCIFLRRAFVVSNVNDVAALQVAALSDDGFIAWINGHEVARFNMPAGNVAYNGVSSPALPEPIPWWTNTLSDIRSFLLTGTNVIAIQAFNSSLAGSSDFIINPALYYTPDVSGPIVTLRYPTPNVLVRELTSIEVAFDEPVAGVDASDLRINNQPATNLVVVTPSQFVFNFPQPLTGVVQVAWAAGHGIHDLSNASNSFSGAGLVVHI
jgi:hypothetical protein